MYFVLPYLAVYNVMSCINNWGIYVLFNELHFHLEEYNTIWTCSNFSPVKCGVRDIVSFTSEVQVYISYHIIPYHIISNQSTTARDLHNTWRLYRTLSTQSYSLKSIIVSVSQKRKVKRK
jgi:hypothetical protein